MSASSDFHDQDFDALEDHLDNLPPARQHAIYLTSTYAVWRLGRKLAKLKKRHVSLPSEEMTVDFRQPLSSSGGWIRFGGAIAPEVTQAAKKLVTDRFDKRGLTVSNFEVGFAGMYDGPEGTYQSLRAWFVVS